MGYKELVIRPSSPDTSIQLDLCRCRSGHCFWKIWCWSEKKMDTTDLQTKMTWTLQCTYQVKWALSVFVYKWKGMGFLLWTTLSKKFYLQNSEIFRNSCIIIWITNTITFLQHKMNCVPSSGQEPQLTRSLSSSVFPSLLSTILMLSRPENRRKNISPWLEGGFWYN